MKAIFEGYEIMREIAISPHSHVVLARDVQSEQQVVIRTASVEPRETAHWPDFNAALQWCWLL